MDRNESDRSSKVWPTLLSSNESYNGSDHLWASLLFFDLGGDLVEDGYGQAWWNGFVCALDCRRLLQLYFFTLIYWLRYVKKNI